MASADVQREKIISELVAQGFKIERIGLRIGQHKRPATCREIVTFTRTRCSFSGNALAFETPTRYPAWTGDLIAVCPECGHSEVQAEGV